MNLFKTVVMFLILASLLLVPSMASAASIDGGNSIRQFEAPADEPAPPCDGDIRITKVDQKSPTIRVAYQWKSTGTESVDITVKIVPATGQGNLTGWGPHTLENQPPNGSDVLLIASPGLKTGTYWVRVTITTDCGATFTHQYRIDYVSPFPKGDVDLDGDVDEDDLIAIQRHILGLEELSLVGACNADVNCDGKVTAIDMLLIRKFILFGTPFPC